MKNTIFKNIRFHSFFCVLLFLSISSITFGQEIKEKEEVIITRADAKKCDEKKIYDEKDYDCHIAYYTKRIAEIKKGRYYANHELGYYEQRGLAYFKKDDYPNALSDFNFVINENRYRKSCYVYRAKVYEKLGDYDSALSDYFIAGDFAEAYLGIGNIAVHKRKYKAALDYYNRAIYKDYRLAKAYFGRAIVYLELGKIYSRCEIEEEKSKAIKLFNDAVRDLNSVIEIDLNNTDAETYLKRALVFDELGETEKAVADRQKYKELSQ